MHHAAFPHRPASLLTPSAGPSASSQDAGDSGPLPSSGPSASSQDAGDSGPLVAGLVLAAGLSTRMGCPKLLLPIGQRPMLSYALEAALSAPLNPVLVVIGPHSPKALRDLVNAHQGLRCINAPHAATGQAASLKAGLEAVLDWERAQQGQPGQPGQRDHRDHRDHRERDQIQSLQGLCVLLGDQPLVRAAHVRLLLQAFGLQPEAFAVPVAPAFADNVSAGSQADAQSRMRRGNPVIIPRAYFGQLRTLQGDTGARPLLRGGAVVQEVVMPDNAVLRDVDSPQEYESLKNI